MAIVNSLERQDLN